MTALVDNVLTYLGLHSIYAITKNFDATRANVVCSARKVLTFVISFLFFTKTFNQLHVVGFVVTVVSASILQYSKVSQAEGKRLQSSKKKKRQR